MSLCSLWTNKMNTSTAKRGWGGEMIFLTDRFKFKYVQDELSGLYPIVNTPDIKKEDKTGIWNPILYVYEQRYDACTIHNHLCTMLNTIHIVILIPSSTTTDVLLSISNYLYSLSKVSVIEGNVDLICD